jgi:hypothetical protein
MRPLVAAQAVCRDIPQGRDVGTAGRLLYSVTHILRESGHNLYNIHHLHGVTSHKTIVFEGKPFMCVRVTI